MLSYPTQQYKVIPHIATAYAFQFVAENMYATCRQVNAQVKKGDFSRIQEVMFLHFFSLDISFCISPGLIVCSDISFKAE